jgi:hypothetical protein
VDTRVQSRIGTTSPLVANSVFYPRQRGGGLYASVER